MTVYRRGCDCDHAYPLCACPEGPTSPEALLRRSNWLSSLAGWPGPVGVAQAAHVIARYRARPSSPDCGCEGRA